ncbi:MAG: class I SAM-dependent methyltransferase [Flammeovirgaceae bacterium]|nr:class I SAM-dependent methyltransferase [Flammeovirgaceae bacterium]
MITIKDIAEYYDTTQDHYRRWWNLKDSLSLHYGIWNENTKEFSESLENTNKVLLQFCNISESDNVLDAGCGVGGAAFFINERTNAQVTGISISENQIKLAKEMAIEKQKEDRINFLVMDFTKTTFQDQSFDVVWACESVCHASNKAEFINECYRLLKKDGRLILSDFFLPTEKQNDKNRWIDKWKQTWGVPNFVTSTYFTDELRNKGFSSVEEFDFTDRIRKSARRMYYASILGALPSELYNLFNPDVSKFAKSHYKSGFYQYKALQENLWKYKIVYAKKIG